MVFISTRIQSLAGLLAIAMLGLLPLTASAQADPSERFCTVLRHLGLGAPCPIDPTPPALGREVAMDRALADGEEHVIPLDTLVRHGARLFNANWTSQEGGGRPGLKGTGAPLSDPDSPLNFPNNFNRISGPDANSCGGCHNLPRSGGGGDFVTNVSVLGQRFDFATFDLMDETEDGFATRGVFDESGAPVTLQTIANSRSTLGMFGSGYLEMLARQMTADLQAIRDSIGPGGSAILETKGVDFGVLARNADGSWDTSGTEGFVAPSIASTGPEDPPNLIIRPFHQASAVISLRQFSNNALNHHHGIQSGERFGEGDADGDGFDNNLSMADVTAITVYQAQLAAPGRVIPRNMFVEQAVAMGEQRFMDVGCGDCHTPALPLEPEGRWFVEPNPYNPAGNLQVGDAPEFAFDLSDSRLDQPRLPVESSTGVIWVPAFTNFKVYDITSGPDDPNCETLDMHGAPGSEQFFAGNCRFLAKRLWGAANEPPYFHHGQYTTMREAIEAHRGDAMDSYEQWSALSDAERDAIIEFLKTLQVLPPGTESTIVDHNFQPRSWAGVF
ncbi:di-heme oxidoredictase family protein [Wenzhouxiangella marina]|uniref:Thiol oxidoreductase-like protein n=1 Tax=Wenzhouxiangella marina TaxID=1579979 RepID=A0A0K0XSA3_9GAMM|nr:di-heme oxidoredictase family protein [Wenzhouxiangella marina]AKS40502.1 Thiol oxidoreductase-like protein [Wenzhouxiangella marina]MBB6088176.1 mono/diheme cytochrome c family protein [Wenzhouxiangella marina]